MQTATLLFDGECNLCNYWVKLVINKNPTKTIKMTSLQSEKGQKLLQQYGLETTDFKTLIYIKDTIVYTKSNGVLELSKELKGILNLLQYTYIFPKFLRNWVYDLVAKNRYNWFGKRATCMVPPANWKDWFL